MKVGGMEGPSGKGGRWAAADPECSTVKVQILFRFGFADRYFKKEKKKYDWCDEKQLLPFHPTCIPLHPSRSVNVQ